MAVVVPGFNSHSGYYGWVAEQFVARGLAVYPMGGTIDGVQGDHVIVAPPYICTAADISAIVERLGDAVDAAVMV